MSDKKATREEIVKSQAKAKSNSQRDLVEVKFTKDSKYYKKGDTDMVHPTTAEIFKAKGLI